MHRFTDAKGRSWALEITIPAVRRVRALARVELLTLFDNDAAGYGALRNDPERLADVLCAICRPQLEAAELSDDDFAEGIAGDAWGEAVDALTRELIFFSRPAVREALQAAYDAMEAQERAAAETARAMAAELGRAEALEALQAQVKDAIAARMREQTMRSKLGDSSTNCLASAD